MSRREKIGADEDIPDSLQTLKEAEDYFTEAKSRFEEDLSDVPMEWQDMGTTAGKTKPNGDIEILLNPKLVEKASHEVPITIIHELAHAAQYKEAKRDGLRTTGHDAYWRSHMRKAGISNPEIYLNLEVNLADNYIIECQNCGNQVGRKRKSKVIKHPESYKCKCGGTYKRIK